MKWRQLLADHDNHVILLRSVSVTPREAKLIQHTSEQDVHTYPAPLVAKPAQVHGDCRQQRHVHCFVQTLQGQGRKLEYDENDASSFR